MKFSPKEEIRHDGKIFEAGNTYDSKTQGVSDEAVASFHKHGWAEVEGKDPAPDRVVVGAELAVAKASHKTAAEKAHG